MTNDEMKTALLNNEKVIYTMHDGAETEMTMFGIVYRNNGKGGIRVSAELLDPNGKSISVCNPKDLKKLSN